MKIKEIKNFSILLLIFIFILTPVSFSVSIDHSQAADFEEIDSNQEWTVDKTIDKNITINADVTVIVRNGVTLTFNGGNIDIKGNMVASGTAKNPIVFKKAEDSPNYSITVKNGGNLTMRNTDVSGSGAAVYMVQNTFHVNTANAFYRGGIQMSGGTLNVQSSNFHDNKVAIYINHESAGKVIVNRSKFFDNDMMDVGFNSYVENDSVNFKYNWWGSADGPAKTCYEGQGCYWDKIEGDGIDFSDWLTKENFRDPVIIISGILGSEKQDGNWQIDPIFHTYDNLYGELVNSGYIPDKNLFTFPYEWRNSNTENAKLLKVKIQEIKQQENWPKVDIIAHSMGGLLAREYIESDDYGNDIDQLITLGTPNNGAPMAYLKWEAGASLADYMEIFMKYYFNHEAKEKGYDDVFNYIQNKVPSVKELLPVYGYLYDTENDNKLITYNASNYPINGFLENLNSSNKKSNLLKVEYDKIIGNVNSPVSTISGLNVIKRDMGEHWKHGYPLGFEIPIIGDRGLIKGYGDGTVPLDSAKSENIFSDSLIELNSGHLDLPTKAQKDVVEILTGTKPATEVNHGLIHDILFVSVFSPIDIQIISPSGKKVGKNFEDSTNINEIDGAYYTGFDTENEFITIPNPEDGEYRILTQGTGSGDYEIKATKISENENDSQNAIESEVSFQGTASDGSTDEMVAQVDGNNVVDPNQQIEKISDENDVAAAAENSDSNNDKKDSDNSKNKKSKKKTPNASKGNITTSNNKLLINIITAKKDNNILSKIENQNSDAPLVKDDVSKDVKTEDKDFKDKFNAILSILVIIFLLGYLLKDVGISKYFKKH